MNKDELFTLLDNWSDEMPNISNETAYVLRAFLQALRDWIEDRYHAQAFLYLEELLENPCKLNPRWNTFDEEDL